MACCRDFNICAVVTTRTCLVCFPANLCACRCLSIVVYNVMVKGINGLCFSRKFSIANGTIHYIVVASCCCACRSNVVFNYCFCRTVSYGNHFVRYVFISAVASVGCVSLFSASRLGDSRHMVVTCCGHFGLCQKHLTTF